MGESEGVSNIYLVLCHVLLSAFVAVKHKVGIVTEFRVSRFL